MEKINAQLAKGEQALVCLRQIELSTSNFQIGYRFAHRS
jgi:hypothetical protein